MTRCVLALSAPLGGMGSPAHEAVPALVKNLDSNQDFHPRRNGRRRSPSLVPTLARRWSLRCKTPDARRRAGAAMALSRKWTRPFATVRRTSSRPPRRKMTQAVRAALLGARCPRSGVAPDRLCGADFACCHRRERSHSSRGAKRTARFFRRCARRPCPKLAGLLKDNNPAARERAARSARADRSHEPSKPFRRCSTPHALRDERARLC